MKRVSLSILSILMLFGAPVLVMSDSRSYQYPANRPPLKTEAFAPLPLGCVKPAGWLKDQLQVQANGLTGHLDEFWPDLKNSAWKGKEGDGWERGPYYLDGLVPLAWLLDDARLQEKARVYLDWILDSGRDDGWFGPAKNSDRWPLSVALKVLTQYQEATGDDRVIPFLNRYFEYLHKNPPDWPDKEWRGVRAMENVPTAYWLYNRTGNPDLIQVAASIQANSFNWVEYFLNFPYTTEALNRGLKYHHPTHVVNIAMAIKHPGVFYQQSGNPWHREAVFRGIRSLDEYHGQAWGRFAGDEHLSGRRPTQGTELCGVVEYMFSLENLIGALGDAALADRLEMLAYNASPGTCTPDYWAHQYDQQANQVLCTKAKRKWSTNGDDSNLYGLEPNFGCCTANMHQGWPKFVSHLWMAAAEGGLAAVAYGPCQVKAKVGPGVEAVITEETDYPFDCVISITMSLPREAAFPLHLRVPGWAQGASLQIDGQTRPVTAGSFEVVKRSWKDGDRIQLNFPMALRTESRYRNAVALWRGPLVFSLKIGEDYRRLKSHQETLPATDWEIYPTTPWNYGLVLDRNNPENSIQVTRRKPGKIPFRQEDAPVTLHAQGRAIPDWTLVDNSAGETPSSPAHTDQPLTKLELIPYGSTRLRITEFPTVE